VLLAIQDIHVINQLEIVLHSLNVGATMTALGVKSVLTNFVLQNLQDIAHAIKIVDGEKFVKIILVLILLNAHAIKIADTAKIVFMENVSEHLNDINDFTYFVFSYSIIRLINIIYNT
jgi:hypothetical protein